MNISSHIENNNIVFKEETDVERSTISEFTSLVDTPNNYTGQANALLKVKPDESGIEFESGTNLASGRITYDYVISTQDDFEKLFGTAWLTEHASGNGWVKTIGSGNNYYAHEVNGVVIPENTKILLKKPTVTTGMVQDYKGRWAYVLKNRVYFSSNIIIHGEGQEDVIVVPNEADTTNRDEIRFLTDYKNTDANTNAINNTFEFAGDISSKYSIGDILYYDKSTDLSKNPTRRITAISYDSGTDITTITVDNDIDVTSGTTGNVFSLVENIELNYFTWDGRGGVNGMGGTIDHSSLDDGGNTINGGVFQIPYLNNTILNLKVINIKVVKDAGNITNLIVRGGVIYGDNSFYIKAKKIKGLFVHCIDTNYNQGAYFYGCIYGSRFSNFNVENVDIKAFIGYGGVYHLCHNAITLKTNNLHSEEVTGSVCHLGGASNCHYCEEILTSNVIIITNYGEGGGAFACNYSKLIISKNITGSGLYGGGASSSTHCAMILSINCSSAEGGGAFACNYSTIVSYGCSSVIGSIAESCYNCESIWGDTVGVDDIYNCSIKGKTISTSAPSGGIDGDVWYQVS